MRKRTEAEIKALWELIYEDDPKKRPGNPDVRTYLSFGRFYHAYSSAFDAARDFSGAVVECGVWKGGAFGIMALGVRDAGEQRCLWGFDTFEGLPDPCENDVKVGERGGTKAIGRGVTNKPGDLAATENDVWDTLFNKFNLQMAENVHLVKGLFADALPKVREEIGSIALLRLDGDLYKSTKDCLELLYDQVELGGKIIIDDYNSWYGCRKAVNEFRSARNIESPLVAYDTEWFWVKT